MKIETTKKETLEIDINFPAYTKKSWIYYKIFSQEKIMRIVPEYYPEISKSSKEFAFGEGFEFVSEKEFETVLENVKKELGI